MLHLETLESRCLLSTLVISDFYDPSTPIASLDFGEGNLVGINYPASIGITNTSGESDTASLAMDSDAFTYQQPGNMETPIGSPYSYYGSSTSLFEEATTLTFGQESEPVLVPATGGDQWFYVDAQAGDNLRFSTTTNSLYSVDLQVYSQYYRESEMVVDGDTFEFYSFSSELDSYDSSYSTQGGSLIMPAPYTGRYYVQATTYGGMTAGSFTVEATTLPANPNLTTIALSEDTNTLIVPFSDDPYAAYTGQANNWYAFDASYGDEIELTFAPQGITTIIDLNEISVYNSFGHHIFSGEYNNYIFTDEGIIADKDAGSFTPKIPPLLADGTYYIAIEPGYFNEPDEYFTINLTKTGSMLELEPDESVEIPIWYTPQADGTAEAQLTIKSLSDEAAPEETVTFTGAAIASDFSVVDLQIENLEFPNRDQALSTLD
ncbi:MAG: hypothetical protein K9M57_03910, partial [Phycisphaerae bacterium]|nr:hypothetical protein [Phycisphaerae bacterium]